MVFLINLLGIVNVCLTTALVVALWERHDRRRFPTEAEIKANEARKREILKHWRR